MVLTLLEDPLVVAGFGLALGKMLELGKPEVASVPNPGGRLGKPPHRAGVAECIDDIIKRGLTVKTEFRVETLGGEKSRRFLDVAGLGPGGEPVVFYQVGKTTASGFPVPREMRAIRDILRYGNYPDVPLWFRPY